ncbi:MAG: bifunctional folylpolyglutamate synthase/dihydrofolate synthase [Actinobacteria bacterium]|nr:bifunctional folylpolyglutamate synthase/dihydrofolate synthase [Actinomycetota bacterium]MBV9256204.1 bifunctional folylpolyglutamate synthase/dihydrofolate synthase [Actinomycetota bacterium]
MNLEEARAWLDDHINLARMVADSRTVPPTLDRVRRLTELLGDPQDQYPVLHLTGTNGKTTTARMLSALLAAKGLSVGTLTSPYLERLNEEMAWNGEPISDGAFVELIEVLADIEPVLGAELRPNYFELITAGAYRWFADIAVDAVVAEVGLGGRWDATNVATAQVAVVTNIELDHMEYLGPTRESIAGEKAGIVKPGSHLVLGETDRALRAIFEASGPATVWQAHDDFACDVNELAHGGRLLTLRTPGAKYEDVYLPLHGAHQGANAACALAAAQAFFGEPLNEDVVQEAFASVTSPGRMEVLSRRPLTVIDGAHNPAGARAAAATIAEEFSAVEGRVLVVGMMRQRDPVEMLRALDATHAKLVVATEPDSPRALPAADVADAATSLGVEAIAIVSVRAAVERALARAEPDDLVFVTGSLYVVGEARTMLRARV